MTEDIRRRDEIEEQSMPYYLHQQEKRFAQHERNNIEFQKEMIERMTRVETQLEHLTATIEKFINSNNEDIKSLNERVDNMEKLADEAHGAIKMVKVSLGVVTSVVAALIGVIMKYVR